MPSYTLTKYEDRVGPGPIQMTPTHEITVTWEKGEERPPFLSPDGVLPLPSGGEERRWRILVAIHYAGPEGERYSYHVREVTP